jgi:hypothetical protein
VVTLPLDEHLMWRSAAEGVLSSKNGCVLPNGTLVRLGLPASVVHVMRLSTDLAPVGCHPRNGDQNSVDDDRNDGHSMLTAVTLNRQATSGGDKSQTQLISITLAETERRLDRILHAALRWYS